MERAQLLAAIGDLTGAISEFDNAIGLGNEDQGETTYAEYWKCLTYNRNLIALGTYTPDKLDSLMGDCPELIITEPEPPSALRISKTTENVAINNEDVLVYPNPTSGLISVVFSVPDATAITYYVSDINGKKVLEKEAVHQEKGKHEIAIDLSRFPNGIYSCTLSIGQQVYNKKVVLIK